MARIQELYKGDLNNPDNHDGVITHLEPDILECEVKWALGSITRNRAGGSDGIPVKLFQILKDDALKVMSLSCARLLVTPWTAGYQAPLSMGFSRQEYWSGVPLPSPSASVMSMPFLSFIKPIFGRREWQTTSVFLP